MLALFLAAALPTLFWDQPADTAAALRQAGIERLSVPPAKVKSWQQQGFGVTAFDPSKAAKATAPKVEYRMDVASATHVPWVDANGWQFERRPAGAYFYDAPRGSAALAAAEAFAYGVEAAVRVLPEDLEVFGRMLQFLRGLDHSLMPVMANIGVVDDGSAEFGEVLNLMARHNLLFRIVPAPDPKLDLNIRLGSAEYPKADASNPYEFAMKVRHTLTDEKRLLRIYGTNVVLGRLTGEGGRVRLQLLNYGKDPVHGIRVRVLGVYRQGKLAAFAHESATLTDYTAQDGATEFTIPEVTTYAVVDLSAQ